MGNASCCNSCGGTVKEDTSNKSTPALLQTTSPPAFAPGAMSVPSTAAPAGTHGPFSLTAQSKTDSNYVFNLLSSDTNGAHYVVYEDGSIYTGQIHDGKRHGFGFWQMQNGRHDQYKGQWQSDLQHGEGQQKWSDGRIYEGQYAEGVFSGKGRMVWKTRDGLMIYEGQYKDDLKNGDGKFLWADGRSYEGQWQSGKRHGRGAYAASNSTPRMGYWLADKFDSWEEPASI